MSVFNTLGLRVGVVVDGYVDAGQHRVAFNADQLPAGVYLYIIEADGFRQTKRMTLLK